MSPNIKVIYDQIVQYSTTKYNATDVKLIIKYLTIRKSFDLTLTIYLNKSQSIEGNLDLSLKVNQKNELTLSYKGTSDTNGKSFYTNVTGLKDMLTVEIGRAHV